MFFDGSRIDDQIRSWIASSNFPVEALDEVGDETGGSLEEREDEDKVDSLSLVNSL
jgi:hypothetical protein